MTTRTDDPDGPGGGALPPGWRIVLDPSVSVVGAGRTLLGGHPARILRLSPAGRAALDTLLAGRAEVMDRAARRLGRRLVDTAMAHPRPPVGVANTHASLTVVIPVRDRPTALDSSLRALAGAHPVLVVDDGSDDPETTAAVCRRHGAGLLVRGSNGGPGAARNDALAVVDTDVVAFVDSDCQMVPSAIERLLPYFADPMVGAVAPRVRPMPAPSTGIRHGGDVLERFAGVRSSLDMGSAEGLVGPERRVRYVPAAALLVRRGACGTGFDPRLRFGEDVDFVWRMGDRGWQVRYVPDVVVHHREPGRWPAHCSRRFRYGSSAGPLARRHPGRMAAVELAAGPAVVLGALVAGRWRLATAAWTAGAVVALGRLWERDVPAGRILAWQAGGPWWAWLGLGRATATVVVPGLPLLALAGRRRRAWTAAALLALPGIVEWRQRRPPLDPARYLLASLADGLSYGSGVWTGCLKAATTEPLLPAIRLPQRGRVRDRPR